MLRFSDNPGYYQNNSEAYEGKAVGPEKQCSQGLHSLRSFGFSWLSAPEDAGRASLAVLVICRNFQEAVFYHKATLYTQLLELAQSFPGSVYVEWCCMVTFA